MMYPPHASWKGTKLYIYLHATKDNHEKVIARHQDQEIEEHFQVFDPDKPDINQVKSSQVKI